MNALQLERWNEVSLGLACSYKNLTPARSKKLRKEVEDCIDWVVCNGLETVIDWDDSVKLDGIQWDCAGTRVDEYLWDNRYEFEREYKNGNIEVVRGRFGDMLAACVRAGFDLAVAPSGGVVGFTVGDLRGAFGGEIPEWVAGSFDPALPANAADSEGVWL